jgi:(p)ppGpp synthase/HD superfamily hydrolase
MNIEETKKFVQKAHEKQLRKYPENTPYYTHLFRVGNILSEYGFSDEVVKAGLLHDLVEDTDYELDYIKENFGDDIAKYVDFVSEDKNLPWKERKLEYIRKLFSNESPVESIAISMADKIDNLEDSKKAHEEIGDEFFKKYMGSKKYHMWNYNNYFNELEKYLLNKNNASLNEMLARLKKVLKYLNNN